MSLSRSCRAAAAVLATTVIVALAPPASADTASDAARVVTLIQQTRASAGAPALRIDSRLTAAAQSWAAKMARDGTISHNVGIGSQISASKLAENVGMGPNVDVVHQGFLNSSGHHANMVDTGVSSLGVGVAYANGYVYVVQDYAQLNATPPPNRLPAVPTELTPANGTILRTSPTQLSARYSDPDGTSGRVHFVIADDAGRIVREGDSAYACSGCVASMAVSGIPSGLYTTYAYASDGVGTSTWAAVPIWVVDQNAPLLPTRLSRSSGRATGVYNDPDGTAGWLYVALLGPNGQVVSQGFSDRVCSGCTASYTLPAMGSGTYTLYAYSYDGLFSPSYVGPSTFVV